jgi:hypothetical protein
MSSDSRTAIGDAPVDENQHQHQSQIKEKPDKIV